MKRVFASSVAAFLLLGCGPDSENTTDPTRVHQPVASRGAELSGRDSSTRRVARAVAMALTSRSVRELLRDSWRDSRISSDHKLVLQTWMALPESRLVLEESARAIGLTPQQFLVEVGRLPDLDFYVPVRRHRQSWRATSDVLVGFTYNQDAPSVEAFRLNGAPVQVYADQLQEGPTLIILHPAEPKPTITSTRALTRDEMIEPVRTGAIRTGATTGNDDPVEPNIECEPYCYYGEGGGGGGGSLPPGVYITYFATFRDDGFFGGDLEMEFQTFGWNGNPPGTPSLSGTVWIFGATCSRGVAVGDFRVNGPYSNMALLISPNVTATTVAGCPGSSSLKGYGVQAIEKDGGLNQDDDFGKRYYTFGSNPSQDLLPFGLFFSGTTGFDYWSDSGNPNPYSGYYGGNPERSLNLRLQIF